MNFGAGPSSSQTSIFGTHGGSQSAQFADLSQLPGSSTFGANQTLAEAGSQLDQNSPELLKENMKRVQTHVELVRSLALTTQHGMYVKWRLTPRSWILNLFRAARKHTRRA